MQWFCTLEGVCCTEKEPVQGPPVLGLSCERRRPDLPHGPVTMETRHAQMLHALLLGYPGHWGHLSPQDRASCHVCGAQHGQW